MFDVSSKATKKKLQHAWSKLRCSIYSTAYSQAVLEGECNKIAAIPQIRVYITNFADSLIQGFRNNLYNITLRNSSVSQECHNEQDFEYIISNT